MKVSESAKPAIRRPAATYRATPGIFAKTKGPTTPAQAQAVMTKATAADIAKLPRIKPKLVDLAVAKLGPVGAEMRRLMADPGEIDAVLAKGAARARAAAAPTLAEVRAKVGFWGA